MMLRLPLSLVLTGLAVLALLTHPVAATAAQVACAQSASAAAMGDDMPGMTTMAMAGADHAQARTTADPCCDPGAGHPPSKDCAQICAVGCVMAAALPATPLALVLVATPVVNVPRSDPSGRGLDPSGLDRPPKFMA